MNNYHEPAALLLNCIAATALALPARLTGFGFSEQRKGRCRSLTGQVAQRCKREYVTRLLR